MWWDGCWIRSKTPPDGSVLNLDSEGQQKERNFSPTCFPIKMKIIGDLFHKICLHEVCTQTTRCSRASRKVDQFGSMLDIHSIPNQPFCCLFFVVNLEKGECNESPVFSTLGLQAPCQEVWLNPKIMPSKHCENLSMYDWKTRLTDFTDSQHLTWD